MKLDVAVKGDLVAMSTNYFSRPRAAPRVGRSFIFFK